MTVERNKDLTGRNTFGLKVSCSCYVEYDSADEYLKLFDSGMFHSFPSPFLHIGGGSNLLFTGNFPGTIFHSRINYIRVLKQDHTDGHVTADDAADTRGKTTEYDTTLIEIGAGTLWDDVCAYCAGHGLWGTENLSGIPGETGAAAVQNIGAYGVEIKDIVENVICYDTITSAIKTIPAKDCGYGYRKSIFKEGSKGRYTVLSVVLRLSRKPCPRMEYEHLKAAVNHAVQQKLQGQQGRHEKDRQDEADEKDRQDGISTTIKSDPRIVRDVILDTRNAKLPDPAKIGNAGSFFKNPVVPKSSYDFVHNYAVSLLGNDYKVPHFDMGTGFVKIPAAWLIEHSGWKGYKEGNVGVYEKQPLVIVNHTGKASPREILSLEKKIVDSVREKFGIELKPEVEHI